MARFKRTEGTKKMKLNELRDNDGARIQDLVVVEDDAAGVRIEADNLARDEDPGAQAFGLA